MAFKGLLISRLDNELSITGNVINQTLIKATVNNVSSLTGEVRLKPALSALLNVDSYIGGLPAINELDVLDVVDYFRTENNINFLVAENGDYLEI